MLPALATGTPFISKPLTVWVPEVYELPPMINPLNTIGLSPCGSKSLPKVPPLTGIFIQVLFSSLIAITVFGATTEMVKVAVAHKSGPEVQVATIMIGRSQIR